MDKCHSRNFFFQWPNVHYSPISFLAFFIFIFTSCALEAAVTSFLHKYHCSLQHWLLAQTSICLIFSIESNTKFSRNSTLVLESFIGLSMLVTSTLVSLVHSVIISRTKSILAFGPAVKSIMLYVISSWADVKSINDNGFLSDSANGLNISLRRSAKFTLSKLKSLILAGLLTFLHGWHSFADLVNDGFVKPVRTAASTRNIAAAVWLHVSLMPACHTTESWLTFLKLSRVYEHVINWLMCSTFTFQDAETTTCKVIYNTTNLIYVNFMLWNFYSHSSLFYQALKEKSLNNFTRYKSIGLNFMPSPFRSPIREEFW